MRKWFGHQAGDLKPGVYDQHGNLISENFVAGENRKDDG